MTGNIKAASDRQKNVSTVIKDGLNEVYEVLDKLNQERQQRKRAQARLANVLWLQVRGPNTTGSTPKNTPVQSKRAATSPAEGQVATLTGKRRRKGTAQAEWTEVVKRGAQKPKRLQSEGNPTPQRYKRGKGGSNEAETNKEGKKRQQRRKKRLRLDALLIKPAEGKSYEDVLRDIKAKIKPEDTGTDVQSIRQARNGDLLLELGKETKDLQAFADVVKATIGAGGSVRNLVPRTTLKFIYLDGITCKEDVEEALKRELHDDDGDPVVSITKASARGQLMAFVQISEQVRNKLPDTSRIKIRWINSRVR